MSDYYLCKFYCHFVVCFDIVCCISKTLGATLLHCQFLKNSVFVLNINEVAIEVNYHTPVVLKSSQIM